MKKLLALLLTLVLSLVLSACNNLEPRNSQNSTIKSESGQQVEKNYNTQQNTSSNENQPTNETESTELISRDRAVEIAVSHAGVNADDVRDLDTELDREYSGNYWEIDFECDRYEYSYEIDAQTGEIVISEKESD